MVEERLRRCLEVVERSMHTGTQGEVLAAKKATLNKIGDITANFKHNTFIPREQASTRFAPTFASLEGCQKFGDLLVDPVCPDKCTLQGFPELSFIQKEVKCILTTFNRDEAECDSKHQLIKCELVSSDGTTAVSETVKKTGRG